jgi:glycosyltransferase involved in cell wall biosynthesis
MTMKILFLASQSFYEERGTPIAVDLLLKVLSKRGEEIDLVTYHLGKDVEYENVKIHRIRNLPFIRSVPPGFSVRKIVCDLFLFWTVISLVFRNRYHIIHAVEESVWIAYVINKFWGTDYIYDMDSSLPRQLLNKYPYLNPFASFFFFLERIAIRNAKLIVPVSDAMVEEIENNQVEKVIVLHDISLLENSLGETSETIRGQMDFDGTLVMYVGNLESYQGIDLLLDSFALVTKESGSINLAIVGGKCEDIQKYEKKSRDLGISTRLRFFGPKPTKYLGGYLSEADILVSPRISGKNTPMKIYSFMESGKAIVATNLRTHTQVLDDTVSVLAEPNPKSFADGMLLVADDEKLREKLGKRGKKLVKEKYNFENFQASVNTIYDTIASVQPIEFGKFNKLRDDKT